MEREMRHEGVKKSGEKLKAKLMFMDIDNTILFSKNQDRVDGDKCTEYRLGKEQGFMLIELEDMIRKIEENCKDTFIIPLTTRSIEQYLRTDLSSICRYGITTCGGGLFRNRDFNLKWLNEQQEKMEGLYDYIYDIFTYLNRYCGDSASFCRIVDNFYVFLRDEDKVKVKELEELVKEYIKKNRIADKLSMINTGTKLTVLPSFLNKGDTVDKFINVFKDIEGYSEIETYGFGDSSFDIPMLEKVDYVLCSKSIKNNLNTRGKILGSDYERFDKEILELLKSL